MKWKKLGRIFIPDGKSNWMHSYASVPVADIQSSNIVKVYFSARDMLQRSRVGYVTFDIETPDKILEVSEDPVLSLGSLGCFDDSGSMASCLLSIDSKKYLYYIGWNLGVTVPFRNSIGLAISEDDGRTFSRYAEGPIVDRTASEPHFTASCCVLYDNECYRMWYLSCVNWDLVNSEPRHRYHIKYAESPDGINWKRDGRVAIDFQSEEEYAISCPRVIRDESGYTMWYSYRGESYRIGFAHSPDGYNWNREDQECGIDVSEQDWDSEMICYPCVFDQNGQRFMLYNGNGYGKTGFGLAVLQG